MKLLKIVFFVTGSIIINQCIHAQDYTGYLGTGTDFGVVGIGLEGLLSENISVFGSIGSTEEGKTGYSAGLKLRTYENIYFGVSYGYIGNERDLTETKDLIGLSLVVGLEGSIYEDILIGVNGGKSYDNSENSFIAASLYIGYRFGSE